MGTWMEPKINQERVPLHILNTSQSQPLVSIPYKQAILIYVESSQIPHSLLSRASLIISFVSKILSWMKIEFFFKELTWESQHCLGWPLLFTLSHSFDSNSKGILLLFICFILQYHFSLRNPNLNLQAQAHHKSLWNTPKYAYRHVTVWILELYPEIY